MQKVFSSVLDIDPNDPTVIELDQLAKRFGLNNMTEVAVAMSEVYDLKNKQLALKLDLTTYQPLVRVLLSMAIVNYGVSVHEEFFVTMPEEDMEKPRFFRKEDSETYLRYADNYLNQAKQIIALMEN